MKNILVTGISKGLGLKITEKLLKNDYRVFGISRTLSNELIYLKNQFSNKLNILQFDLNDIEHIQQKIFNDFINKNVPIYGFINNAAFAYDDIITNANYQKLIYSFNVNFFSVVMIIKYVIRNMLLHEIKGSLIHLSSISVHTGYKGLSMYAASKGALEALSKNIAREWGTKGIRSNCIIAGFMETDMSSKLSFEQKSRIYERTALKKPTSLDSVANTALFLLSDESDSITGSNIFIDSGTI